MHRHIETRRITMLHHSLGGDGEMTFEYAPSFDPWDNFAAARYLYEQRHATTISTDMEYVKMIHTDEFKDILGQVNAAEVLASSKHGKTFLMDAEACQQLDRHHDEQFQSRQLNLKSDNEPKLHICLLNPSPYANGTMRNIEEALHQGFHQEANEVWHSFKVACGELPQDISQYDAIIITGSCASVYDLSLEWIEPLKDLIRQCHHLHKRLYGVCFGHQIIAEALGGKVMPIPTLTYNLRGRRPLHQAIQFDDMVFEQLNVQFAHGDQVVECPPHVEPLFSADHCQIVGYQGPNVLGMQFHPEYNVQILKFLAHKDGANVDKNQLYKEIDESYSQYQDDTLIIQKITRRYLKVGIHIQLHSPSVSPAVSP